MSHIFLQCKFPMMRLHRRFRSLRAKNTENLLQTTTICMICGYFFYLVWFGILIFFLAIFCLTGNTSYYKCTHLPISSIGDMQTGQIVTACVRGKVMFSCCLSLFLSIWAITFECLDIETLFFVWWYILTTSRSSLSTKVIGSKSLL